MSLSEQPELTGFSGVLLQVSGLLQVGLLWISGLLLVSDPCSLTDHAGASRGAEDVESNDVTRRFCLQLDDLSRLSHLLSSFFTNLFKAVGRTRSV